MIQLDEQISFWNSYIHAGNIFSKLLLFQKALTSKQSFLYIIEEDKKIPHYKKTALFIGISFTELTTLWDFIDYYYNDIGHYITHRSFLWEIADKKQYIKDQSIFNLDVGQEITPEALSKKLLDFGYNFSEYEKNGSYQIQWDTLNFTHHNGYTTKISFWWDSIESIETGLDNKSIKKQKVSIWRNTALSTLWDITCPTGSNFDFDSRYIILDNIDFYSIYESYIKLDAHLLSFNNLNQNESQKNLEIQDLYLEKLDDLQGLLKNDKRQKFICTKNKKTLESFLELNNFKEVVLISVDINTLKSFASKKQLVICDDNISRIFVKKRLKKKLSENMDLLLQIKPGDYIVHIDHGIGVFAQIVEKQLWDIKKEYIQLEYKGSDKLFVPITEVGRVSKYVGSENPKLTALSTKDWEKKLHKASVDVEKLAHELLDLYAKRKIKKGFAFAAQSQREQEFAHSFEYVYTSDQIQVISEIYSDMESIQPMDRLVSGDVWFGKTEIAFAAIYKAIICWKQAAFISPLVVLAYEHYEKAKKRFEDFPITIEIVTRFESARSVKSTLQRLKEGKIDLLIGTHRLLSKDVEYKDLWILVVDEEHKFWVQDKEKIKKIKGNIDILSLSATPIPRSLNMALWGIKQLSLLTTPPMGRQPISTIVCPMDPDIISQAWEKEFERNGQIFFIHNRVASIDGVKKYLQDIFPKRSIIVTHGQLPWDQLEQRIIDFKHKKYDILLSTTVIENGIDFSNVNTIFINDADNFGISQIHQLRGRVGRSDKKGYCYLMFKKDSIKEDAAKRLKTIVDYSHLWAWFDLAVKDLEIRGSGDILWMRQSGQSVEIWMNLYLEMLENRIEQLKHENLWEAEQKIDNAKQYQTSIELPIGAYIHDNYFNSDLDKLNFYREIEKLDTLTDLNALISDFIDINDEPSQETKNFFDLLKIQLLAREYKIKKIKKQGIHYQIEFYDGISLEELKKFLIKDTQTFCIVISGTILRSPVKNYTSLRIFLDYLLDIFSNTPGVRKIKLKKKL